MPSFCLPALTFQLHSAGVQKPGWVWGDAELGEGGQWQVVAVATGRGPALGGVRWEGFHGNRWSVFPTLVACCCPYFYLPNAGHRASGVPLLSPVCAANFISSQTTLRWFFFSPIRDAPLLISFYWWEYNYFTSSSRITDYSFKYAVKLYCSASY